MSVTLDKTIQTNSAQTVIEPSSKSPLESKTDQVANNRLNRNLADSPQPELSQSFTGLIDPVEDDAVPKKTAQQSFSSTDSSSIIDRVRAIFKKGHALKAEAPRVPERAIDTVKDSEAGGAFYDAFLENNGVERLYHLGEGTVSTYSLATKAASAGSKAVTAGAEASTTGSETAAAGSEATDSAASEMQNAHIEHLAIIADGVAAGAAGAVVVDDLVHAASLYVKTVKHPPKSTEEKQELAGQVALNSAQLVKDGLNVAKTAVILSHGATSGAATALSIAAPAAAIPVQLAMIGISAKGIHDGRQFIQDARGVLTTIPQDGSSFERKGTEFVNNVAHFFEKYIDTELTPKEKQKLEQIEERKLMLEQQPGRTKDLNKLEIKKARFEKRIQQRQREKLAKLVGSKAATEAQEWLNNRDSSTTVESACGIMFNVMRKSWRRQVEKTTDIACSGTMIAGAALAPATHGASLAVTAAAVVGFKLADCALHLNAKLADATSKQEPWSPEKRDEILQDLRHLAEAHAEMQGTPTPSIDNAKQMTDAQLIDLSHQLIRAADHALTH